MELGGGQQELIQDAAVGINGLTKHQGNGVWPTLRLGVATKLLYS